MAFRFRNLFNFTNRNNIQKQVINAFNEAFFWGSVGGEVIDDDTNIKKYIDYGYNINPDVYSVVNQVANKFTSIPYVIKKINDNQAVKQLNILNNSTKYDYSFSQEVKAIQLKEKAYSEEFYDMPFERPNPYQTWQEFWTLTMIFLQTTGNYYWYTPKPGEGLSQGTPVAIYVLPSTLIDIVIKDNARIAALENPIDYYLLSEGKQCIEFPVDCVIHGKYPNPNFDENGSHLYGQSPLRAVQKNIESTNKGLDLSVNTMKNGGAFGFIHAKDNQTPLTPKQAVAIKERLKEMNADAADLSRISSISQSIGFTRISLTTDELKPFDYFKYNMKQICNALSWDDKLLNSDDGAKYDNMKVAEKRVVMSKTVPDVKLVTQSFNQFLMMFKEYQDKCIDFMIKELPEMQQDYKTMIEWLKITIDSGLLTRNQALKIMGMETNDNENMNVITVLNDIMTLDDAILPQDNLQI